MTTFRTVIVEDEPPAARRLQKLLQEHDQVEVVGSAESGPEAVEVVNAKTPDLLFLDIDLPGFDGFESLRRIETTPLVVFTTGYDDYALRAFRTSSIDYLLKPVGRDALGRAMAKLDRLTGAAERRDLEQRLRTLLEGFDQQSEEPPFLEKLTVRSGDRALLVDVSEVTHFLAKNKYVYLHSRNSQERIVDWTLAELTERLDPRRWVRVHRSTIVAIDQIAEIQTWFGGKYRLLMHDKDRTTVVMSKGMARNLRQLVDF